MVSLMVPLTKTEVAEKVERVETIYEDFTTINDVVDKAAHLYESKIALRMLINNEQYRDVTYQQLLERVRNGAARLKEGGLGSGDHIAIMGANSPEWVISAFAILQLGGVLVPIDAKSTKDEVEHIFSASKAKAFIADKNLAKGWVNDCRLRFTIGSEDNEFPAIEGEVEKTNLEFPKRAPGDLALLVYTSGTTGTSKGVMLTHYNILSDLGSIALRIPIKKNEPVLSILPLSHMLEYTAGMLYPISCGAPITYLRKLKGAEILLNMQLSKTAVMIAVPRILQLLRSSIERQLDKLPTWQRFVLALLSPLTNRSRTLAKLVYRKLHERMGGYIHFMVVGGAPIHKEVIEFFHNFGLEVIQGYGLTETSPVLSANALGVNRVGTVGRPLDKVEIKIDGPEGMPGEILVRGPMVMKGYFENAEATAEVLDKGWFKTGDLGFLDEEGALVICGRRKALIVTANGKNIYPEELEAVLGRSSYIRELCVVAQKQDKGGEKPYAFVVPEVEMFTAKLGNEPSSEDIKKTLQKELRQGSRNLSDFKRLAGWEIHEEDLPKTCTQKIRRFLLQQKLDESASLNRRVQSSDEYPRVSEQLCCTEKIQSPTDGI